MREIRVIFLMTVLLPVGILRVVAQECDRLQDATSDELVSYLSGIAPDQGNGECITFAINRLGKRRYEPAISLLARLLDFRRPRNPREKEGLYLHIQVIEEIYPAANALEEIGHKALPTVLDVIKADSNSTTARENAVAVWMEIHKYKSPTGVAQLKQELDNADNLAAEQNLKWALSRALSWCNPPDKAQCETAAKTGHTD